MESIARDTVRPAPPGPPLVLAASGLTGSIVTLVLGSANVPQKIRAQWLRACAPPALPPIREYTGPPARCRLSYSTHPATGALRAVRAGNVLSVRSRRKLPSPLVHG